MCLFSLKCTISHVLWFVCCFISSLFLHCDSAYEPLQRPEVSQHLVFNIWYYFRQHSELLTLYCRAYRSNSLKHDSLYEAFLPFLSPALLFILSTTWVVFSPSNVLELQPRIFYLMVGTAFANVTVSVIFHMTQPLSFALIYLFILIFGFLACQCLHVSRSVSSLCVR